MSQVVSGPNHRPSQSHWIVISHVPSGRQHAPVRGQTVKSGWDAVDFAADTCGAAVVVLIIGGVPTARLVQHSTQPSTKTILFGFICCTSC